MSHKKESLGDVRLHAAACCGDLITLRHMLDSGRVHSDSRDKEGTTPLMKAVAAGHFECCRELLRNGAHPAQRRMTGAGPLFLAAQGGFLDIVRLLIRSGAEINAQCKDGGTSLMIAAQLGYADVCSELIDNGADIRQQMKDGATALFLAAQNGHAKVVHLILAAAGQLPASVVNIQRTTDGATPLWMAAQMGHDHIIKILMKAGANIEVTRCDGVTPLLKACQKGHQNAVRELVEWSPSTGLAQNGDSPLYVAVQNQNVPIIRMLIKAGADPHLAGTRSKIAPIILAEKLRLPYIVRLLEASRSHSRSP